MNNKRIKLIQFSIILLFSILLLRLFWLQIIYHNKYSTLAEQNRIRISGIPAKRGKILDRNGKILADSRASFQYIYHKKAQENLEDQFKIISKCLLAKNLQHDSNQPIIARRLSAHELTCLSLHDDVTTSFALESRLVRFYPYGEITSHLLGYLAPATTTQIESFNTLERKAITNTGRSGIELIYEEKLRGQPGWMQHEVNARGHSIRKIDEKPPITGEDIYLTIDIDLQKMAYDALYRHTGAFVIIDPNDGSLLALASRPTFNANEFSYGIPKKLYQNLLENPQKPLYNRATQGLYPPASTIKPYYALLALENGVSAKHQIFDSGAFILDNSSHIFHCWKLSGHGLVDLQHALAVSCDTYFYKLSLQFGGQKLHDWLQLFGFQESLGKPLTYRSSLIPSPEWKKNKKQKWTTGDTINMGIGQGAMLTTPLHAALAISRIAMRGDGYAQRLTKHEDIVPLEKINIQESSWDQVISGMQRVITDADGTAHSLSKLNLDIAAKTGTAQVVGFDKNKGKQKHTAHHWLVGFYPATKPLLAFAILVEHEHAALEVAEQFFSSLKEPYIKTQ